MISPIIVVAHELADSHIQVSWDVVWDLVDIPFDGLVIPLQLAVGLRMIRRGQNMTDAHQVQVILERTRDAAWALSDSNLVRPSMGTSVMPVRSTAS